MSCSQSLVYLKLLLQIMVLASSVRIIKKLLQVATKIKLLKAEMAIKHGIGEFDSTREDWTSYTERLAQYFVANDIADAGKKRAILLSACGPSTYQLIRNLASPTKPAEKSYYDLVKLVSDHLHPTPTVACQRYNFNTHKQKEAESIAEYVAELRRIAEHCKYDAMLEEMLRDKLMC